MKQKIILLISVVLFSFGVFSQFNERDTVIYRKVYDYASYKYFGAGLCYDFSMSPYNWTVIALGLDATFLGDKFYANVTSRFHLASKLADGSFKPEPTARSVYRDDWSRDLSLNGTFFLSKFQQTSKFPLTLKKTGSTEYVAFVPAEEMVILGADMGLTFMTTYYNMGNVDLVGINNLGEEVDYNGDLATFLTQKILRFGISRLKTVDYKIRTDKFGEKGSAGISKLYIHTLIGFGQRLDDVFRSFPEAEYADVYQRLDINTNAKFLPVGGAVGYESAGVGKIVNMGYALEAGLMPGPRYSVLSNLYLDLKIRFNLGKKF